MITMRSAAYVLPEAPDLAAIMLALADVKTDSAIYTQLERCTGAIVLWILTEGEDSDHALAEGERIALDFGLTPTEL